MAMNATAAAAAVPIVVEAMGAALAPKLGEPRIAKGKLVFARDAFRIGVVVKPTLAWRARSYHCRPGTLLDVTAVVRVPAIEGLFHPALTAKQHAKLPFRVDAEVQPTMIGSLEKQHPAGHYWDLGEVTPARVGAAAAKMLAGWLPMLNDPSELARRAVFSVHPVPRALVRGLKEPAPLASRPVFVLDSDLVAAAAFHLAGNSALARKLLSAWARHPDHQQLHRGGSRNYTQNTERLAVATRLGAQLGVAMPGRRGAGA